MGTLEQQELRTVQQHRDFGPEMLRKRAQPRKVAGKPAHGHESYMKSNDEFGGIHSVSQEQSIN